MLHNDGNAPLTVSVDLTTPAGDPDLAHRSRSNELADVTIAPGDPPVDSAPGLRAASPRRPPDPDGGDEQRSGGDRPCPITLAGTGVTPIPIDSDAGARPQRQHVEPAGDRIKIEALRDAVMLYTDLLRPDIGGTGFGDKLGFWKYNDTNSHYLAADFDLRAGYKNALARSANSATLPWPTRPGSAGPAPPGIGGAMQNAASGRSRRPVGGSQPGDGRADRRKRERGADDRRRPRRHPGRDPQICSSTASGLGSNIEAGEAAVHHQHGDRRLPPGRQTRCRRELCSTWRPSTSRSSPTRPAWTWSSIRPTSFDLQSTDPIIVDTRAVVSSDRSANFLVLDDPAMRPFYDLRVRQPDGDVIVPGSPSAASRSRAEPATYRIYRIVFPDVSQAASYVGDWVLQAEAQRRWDRETLKQAACRIALRAIRA